MSVPAVSAAGAVVWRKSGNRVDVVLIHRPRYDDWTFPKGKGDPAEHPLVTAIREVGEETGLTVRLGPPLPMQRYDVADGLKHVRYWSARQLGDGDVSGYQATDEVDGVGWFSVATARRKLTYMRDREVLEAFVESSYTAEPLVVLRHARARSRSSWRGPDASRTLTPQGKEQARRLIPLLQAYGVRRVVSSDATRCSATVEPYAVASGSELNTVGWLSEERADPARIGRRLRALLDDPGAVAICSHRPVLPEVFGALGVENTELRPGEFVVVHRRGRQAFATERHRP